MHDRREPHRLPSQGRPQPTRRSRQLICMGAVAGLMCASIFAAFAAAQDLGMPAGAEMDSWDSGAPPVTNSGEGSFFSQDLGTTLRARYNTRSYGQDGNGNLDIGSMQVVSFEDSIAFLDGQVTLSDVNGVGFNVGVGYRWLSIVPYSSDPERVNGISLWGDGTSTEADNFFPQIGISLESLGEFWDLRGNGYLPVGQDDQVGRFTPTGEIGFQGNFISELSIATLDSSFYVAEVEAARRLGAQRDAWGFAGTYVLANEDQDTAGYRAGIRGYAYPDLLLQLAVTHDDIFDTNTTFSLTWFIGRTRTNFHPACGVPDRFREPVMRNDYVALAQSTVFGGTPLTDADGDPFRVVHVDSDAAGGGDGTFERPLNNLDEILGNSQNGDIVLAHALSQFTGQSAVLQANQRFLGEGNGIEHTIDTQEEGVIPIPETFPGATNAARPIILNALGDAVTITDLNEVSNFTIDGGTRGIVAGAQGAGNPDLHDLTIQNTTDDAIALTPFIRTDTNDDDNDGNVTEQTVAFNVNIEDVTFNNIGGDDIDLNADVDPLDVTDPNVTLQEAIVIQDINSTNGKGAGLRVQNTHAAGTLALTNYTNTNGDSTDGRLRFSDIAGDVTITNADITGGTGFALDFDTVATTTAVTVTQLDYNGMTGAAGGIRMSDFDGTFTASNSTLMNGTLDGVSILGESDGTFTFQNTVTMTNLGNAIGSTAFLIDGGALSGFTGVVSVANAITNDIGLSVVIRGIDENGTQVTFNGNITDTGQGIVIEENDGGSILFSGNLDLDTTTNNAITLTNNTDTTIDFAGLVDIVTTDGNGFDAMGGGTLTVSNTSNTIRTTNGRLVRITGMTISATGVNFSELNRTGSPATEAVLVQDNTGGPIVLGTVGDDAGESGTIAGGTADAIVIQNSANVTVSGLTINNGTNAVAGVRVNKTNNNAMTVNINDLDINGGDTGIAVDGDNTTGNLTMTLNDTTLDSNALVGANFTEVDNGTITVNNLDVNGGGAATTAGIQIVDSNATFNFNNETSTTGVAGTDFEVSGGEGTIAMNGDITNNAGRSIDVHDITGGTVTFGTENVVTDTVGSTGIRVADNSSDGTINFNGTYSLTTGANDAVTITDNTGATINFSPAGVGLDITTTSGQVFVATGGGTLTVAGINNTISRTAGGITGSALHIEDMTIGAVDFESVNATGGLNGVRLVNNTNGTITIGDTGNSAGQGGTITGTADQGVFVQNTNVVLNGVTVANAGNAANENGVEILHTNSIAMNANLNRLTVNNTTAMRDGVVIDGTGGSGTFNANIQNLEVDVTGDGLVVTEGVTLTAGGANNIVSDTGVGLTLTDITIAAAGANFNSVDVTNGATSGIVMQNVTGGQVAITGTGTDDDSGGMLDTDGNAIVLTNVQNVDLQNITVTNASGVGADGVVITHDNTATTAMDVTIDNVFVDDANDAGMLVTANDNSNFTLRLLNSDIDSNVAMAATGSGDFIMLVDATTIDAQVTSGDVGFSLDFSGSLDNADVTLRNVDVNADNASALAINSSGGTPKIFDLLIDQGSSFTNNDADSAALIQATGGTTINASIFDNAFTNNGAGEAFEMIANGAGVDARLDLEGNTANAGAGDFVLNNVLSASDFEIFDLTNTFNNSRNTGTVVPLPNAAAFQNRVTPVPLPTIP